MTYTITTNAGGTIFTAGLGTVRSESITKDSDLFAMNMPLSDSDATFILPALFGVSRNIKIEGTFTTSDGTITTFLDQLYGLIDGSTSSKKYHSDTTGHDYYVAIASVEGKRGEAEVSKIDWSISMTECEQSA